MSRRSPGEGSITQRNNGLWQGALQINGRRKTVYGKTRSEVAEKLRSLTAQVATSGRLPDSGKLTLSSYFSEWLSQAEARLRPGTVYSYRALVRCHVLPQLGSVKLSRLQALHLTRLYADLRQKGLSPRRVQMVHRLLHKALGDAARWGLLATNVAGLVDGPTCPTEEPELWCPEKVSGFVSALEEGSGGQYGMLFGFLLASGCREGEALGLRWSDVDWEKSAVRVERQVTWVDNQPVELLPKTRSGVRAVSIPSWGIGLLRKQKAQVAEWRLRAGEGWQGGERVFTTANCRVPSPSNLRRAFLGLCQRLELPAVRLHDLRHLHLSLLAMNGVPVKVAQARAGHSSPILTLRVYQHVLGEPDREAAAAIERLALR